MRSLVLPLALMTPLAAAALEPGRPNPIACVERTQTASVVKVSYREGVPVAVELAVLTPKDRKACAGKKAMQCKALRPSGRELAKGLWGQSSKPPAIARAKLAKLSYWTRHDAKPRTFWNANELMKRIVIHYGKKADQQVGRKILEAVAQRRKDLVGTLEVDVPIGELELRLDTMAVFYVGSSTDAEVALYPMRLR